MLSGITEQQYLALVRAFPLVSIRDDAHLADALTVIDWLLEKPEEVEVEASAREGFVAAEERGYVVALETTLTPELVAEGLVRDLTHLVQEARKHAGLAIEDTIALTLWADDELAAIARRHAVYISDETLARDFAVHTGKPDESAAEGYMETIPAAKLGGHAVTVRVRKL